MQCWFYFKAHKCASVPAPANGNVKFRCSFSYSRNMSGTSCAYRSVQRWRESILKYSTFWCRLEPDPWYLNFLYVWIIHVIHLPCKILLQCPEGFSFLLYPAEQGGWVQATLTWTTGETSPLDTSLFSEYKHRAKTKTSNHSAQNHTEPSWICVDFWRAL